MAKQERVGQAQAEKPAKLKMSNKKFRVLLIIPMVIITLVAILATVAGNMLSSTLDTYLGKGETYVETPTDRTNWDSSYYDYDVQSADGQAVQGEE